MFLKFIITCLIGLIACVLLTELVLQVIHYPSHNCKQIHNASETFITRFDPLLGWSYIPHKKSVGDYGVSYVFNSEGYRVASRDTSTSWKKPIILIVGDSLLFGHGIEFQDTFGYKLEQTLQHEYDVLNFSVQGFGTDQIYLLIKKLIPLYHPRYVITNYLPDHNRRNVSADRRDIYPCYTFSGSKPRFEIQNGHLKQVDFPKTYKEVDAFKTPLLFRRLINKLFFFQKEKEGKNVSSKLLDEIHRFTQSNNAGLYILTFNLNDNNIIKKKDNVLEIIIKKDQKPNPFCINEIDCHPSSYATSYIVNAFMDKFGTDFSKHE